MSVLLLSGGLDSCVLLAREAKAGRCPICLTFDYGQRHVREIKSAEQIARHYKSSWTRLWVPGGLIPACPLTGTGVIPHGKYDDPCQEATIVPNRNMLLLSMAGAFANSHGHREILFAAHRGDAAVYPDCRPEFVSAMDTALRVSVEVRLNAPFLGMTKADVFGLGIEFEAPLALTWSCYEGGIDPCGQCGACNERMEAEKKHACTH
jgi:7-cyano-7-deazaguanine synthase